jgi:hypothetical protein
MRRVIPCCFEPQIQKWILNDTLLFSQFDPSPKRDPRPSDVAEMSNVHLLYFCEHENMAMRP